MSVKLPEGAMGSVKEFHGGVHLEYKKNTSQQDAAVLPTPSRVRIPVSMHIGPHCVPVVKPKDEVKVGQLIADSDSQFASPVHASVSGTVKFVRDGDVARSGAETIVIEIESDGLMTKADNLVPPSIQSKEDFIQAVRNSGVVGLGGAGFPTSGKLLVPDDVDIDTLIVNGGECEPYITVDEYTMMHYTDDMLDGIAATLKWKDISQAIIGIEDNKMGAVHVVLDKINSNPDKYKNIKVLVTKTYYPRGAEKMLIYNATGREVPENKLPFAVGCIVLNVSTLAEIGKYLRTGVPLVSRMVTVDGSAVSKPQNVIVPVGTSIEDVLQFVGLKEQPDILLMGGPMMGVPISNLDRAIIKQNNAILALLEKDVQLADETECIRCSRCIDACPVNLQPTSIMKAIKAGDLEKVERLHVNTCMECGCCDFVCPAKIPLVQYFRHGKKLLRNAGGSK